MNRKAYIKGIETYLPEVRMTNEQLANLYPEWNVKKIFEKTGISSRAIAQEDECVSDLAVKAIQKLFDKGICNKDEIEFLMICTQSPDYRLPTTACLVQNRLGLPTSCGALDFNLGCSGYVYGLSMVKGMIESGIINNAILVMAETYTKYVHPSDRSARTIFGDGAAATFIASKEAAQDFIGPFVFGTDGSGAEELIVPAGGLRMPISTDTSIETDDGSGIKRSPENLFMNGAEIFNFTLKSVPPMVNELLLKSGYNMNDIDMFVFHQANKFILDRLRKKLKISEDKFCINNEFYANTVSASIPMALELEINKGGIKSGDRLMLVGFGVGLSWSATMINL